jgi:MFS family permease
MIFDGFPAEPLVAVLSGAAFFGWFFFSPLYTQHILGYDALQTGLSFLPATLTMAALSLGLSARIVAIFGPKKPLVAGMFLFAIGLGWFSRAPVNGHFLADVLPPMFLLGVGAGISFMPLVLIATAEADPSESGLVSGLISTSQMIGGAIGLAVLASIALVRTAGLVAAGQPQPAALNSGYHAAFAVGAALSLVTALVTWTQLRATPAGR